MCSFTGPIYGTENEPARFVTPDDGGSRAEVPSAFYKVVAFIDKQGELAVRAFIQVQDASTLSDRRGMRSRMFDLKTYQVSVKMIEEETGLVFSQAIRDANPLLFTTPDLPEIIPVTGPDELVGAGEERPPAADPARGVRIVAVSMIGMDTNWASVFNTGPGTVNLDGWTLLSASGDSQRERIAIPNGVSLLPGEALRVESKEPLGADEDNQPSRLELLNKEGQRVDSVSGFGSGSIWLAFGG